MSTEGIAASLTATDYKQPQQILITQNKRIQKLVEDTDFENKDASFLDVYNQKVVEGEIGTLKAGMDHQQGNIIYDCLRIRKLTPKECWRLQGFDDSDVDLLTENNISNTQLYKMAGNSITVDVLVYIFANLKSILKFDCDFKPKTKPGVNTIKAILFNKINADEFFKDVA